MKHALIIIISIVVLLFGLSVTAYFVTISISSSNTEDVLVVIKNGDGIDSVTEQIKQQDLIKSKLVFKLYLFLNNKASKIQPGEYRFKQVNTSQIVSRITQSPEKRDEISLVFKEGETAQQMEEKLIENSLAFDGEFTQLVDTTDTRSFLPDKKYNFLADKPKNIGLEGYLFPDTYRIYTDATPADIIEKMLDNLEVRLTKDLIKDIDNSNLKISETITLASIVEKEARTKEDKKIVAGIFLKRLEIDMRLESDATINYITGKQTTRPTYKDLESDNLYNTYKFSGLPPGPICNPGMDSIEAVIYPEKTDNLFFLNTPSGSIVYSKTYEEHLTNKNKYYPE